MGADSANPNYNFNAVDAFSFVTFHTSPGFQQGDLLYLSDDGLGLLKYQYNGSTWVEDGFNKSERQLLDRDDDRP